MIRVLAIAIILSSLFFAGCARGGSEGKQPTPEEAKKNAELEKTAPFAAPTLRGDVERINLAITDSLDSLKQQKWGDVTQHLNTARDETQKAIDSLPDKKKVTVMKESLEGMKSAIDQTLQSVTSRSKNVEAQILELRTRATTLKLTIPATPTPAS